jgi:parallel beta-helix repeat protein
MLPCFSLDISGNQSGEWSAENNPYQIVGNVTVPDGEELIIQENVEIIVTGNYQITVQGKLQILGTEANPVNIYHQNQGINWSGFRFENETQPSILQFANIQHAENGINSINSPLVVENCHFNYNQKAIHIFAIGNPNPPNIVIDSCLIENCRQNGIYIVENSNVTISNNEIRQCALDQNPRGAVMLSSQGGECSPSIINNFIHHNIWQGISAWDITGGSNINPWIVNNEISYNLTGIYLYFASGTIKNNHIHHNFVSGNPNSGAGIMLQGNGTFPICTFNEIHHNFCAVYLYQQASGNFGCLENYTAIDDGENHFYNNWDESGNLWSIYNASSFDVWAQNNIWDSNNTSEIQTTIMDGNDNSNYGIVDFLPIYQETSSSVTEIDSAILHGNFPNPFNPETIIFFQTETTASGEIAIFNLKGQKISTLYKGDLLSNTKHEFLWNGLDYSGKKVSSGTYFYSIRVGENPIFKKITLLK